MILEINREGPLILIQKSRIFHRIEDGYHECGRCVSKVEFAVGRRE